MQKTIVVSGASKGIGKAIVMLFAAQDWKVAFCSRSQENLDNLKQEVLAENPNAALHDYVCDVSKKDEILSFAENVKKDLGQVDILVNNAGIFLQGSLHDGSDDNFEQVMQTNLYSAYYLTKSLVGDMKERKSGHIFNMSSIAGFMAYPNGGSYNVSKFALTGFSKTLRDELREFGIRVTGIYPGATLTASWAGVDLPEERFMKPEDIAQNILDIYNLSSRTVVEDIILRPQLGDI